MSERKRKTVERSALAALWGAWLHAWAQRPDQRPTWEDAAIVAGLLLAWGLGRADGREPKE